MFKKTSCKFALAFTIAMVLAPAATLTAQSGVVSGGDPQPTGNAVPAVVIILTTLSTMKLS